MDFIHLLSFRHQCETGVQKYAEIEYDRDYTYLVTVSNNMLKIFIIRKWMTVIHILLNTNSTFWKDGKASQLYGKVVKFLVTRVKDNVMG